jgi:glutamate synthase (ferredoxin)
MVSAYLTLVAEDVRRILASLGLRSIGEAVGRTDLLGADRDRIGGSGPEVSGLLGGPPGGFVGVPFGRPRSELGDRLSEEALPALLGRGPSALSYPVTNRDRAVGASLGGAAARALGEDEPPGRVRVSLRGDAGQSLGAFLTDGVELHLTGTANDGVGKGMAGGRIAIAPTEAIEGHPELIGNTALYGATGGELFVAGAAGERFAVRNSGATAVVQGIGANGCEYMTGGLVVVIGSVGQNFAAGMTGGLAYVLDPEGALERFTNLDLVRIVDLSVDGRHELADLLRRHARHTASERAREILASWPAPGSAFRCVVLKRPATVSTVAETETAEIAAGSRR